MSRVTPPTIGRKVWYWGASNQSNQAEDATVCFVHNDRLVNLRVTDHFGDSFPVANVTLRQPDDARSEFGAYCEWMPYQVSQHDKNNEAAVGVVTQAVKQTSPFPAAQQGKKSE